MVPLAATPRPSASVILVRDGPTGLEAFMVRRHARSRAFASAYVFPGGTVRDDDRALPVKDAAALADAFNGRSDSPVSTEEAAAFYVCAVRELFEEAGVLLVRDAAQQLLRVDASDTALQERLESTRLTLQAGELSIAEVLQQGEWQPAFDRLVPFSHWITPRSVAARFDTRFFVAELPAGQSALHDTIETSEGIWLAPARALQPDYHTVYATAQHLERLRSFQTVQDLVRFAQTKSIRMVSPELAEDRAGLRAYIRPDIADSW
jgi:8-oxo-dGTP pyrophosphatase MutT (NUDIX family)